MKYDTIPKNNAKYRAQRINIYLNNNRDNKS